MLEIRKCVDLELCDARVDLRWKKLDANINLDDGVILALPNSTYFQGVKAIQFLENICTFKGVFFTLQHLIFSNTTIATIVYEVLKLLRKIALVLKKFF